MVKLPGTLNNIIRQIRRMSEFDDLDPYEKRWKRMQDPAGAAAVIAADARLKAALLKQPSDIQGLRDALRDNANPDRTIINGFPALHVAIHRKDIKALEVLLRYAAQTDDVNAEGYNALDEAQRQHWPQGVKLLKQEGAEFRVLGDNGEVADDPYAPRYQSRINNFLFEMVRKGTPEQVKQALELGADANAPQPSSHPYYPALHLAACYANVEKVKILLDAGADIFARSSRGHDVTDTMWQSGRNEILSPSWFETFDLLQARGFNTLFLKHPKDFSMEDLRQKVFIQGNDDPTLLEHMVEKGRADFVFSILEKHPDDKLRAADLLQTSKYYNNTTLLRALHNQKQLSRIFTSAVWQGRLEEMMSLRPAVENDFMMKKEVDFDKARAEVLEYRLRDLKKRAPSFKLGKG